MDKETIRLLEEDFQKNLERYGLRDIQIDMDPNMGIYINFDIFKKIVEKEDIDNLIESYRTSDSINSFMKNYDLKGDYTKTELKFFFGTININLNELFIKRITQYYSHIYEELLKIVEKKRYDIFYDAINKFIFNQFINYFTYQQINGVNYYINMLKLYQYFLNENRTYVLK